MSNETKQTNMNGIKETIQDWFEVQRYDKIEITHMGNDPFVEFSDDIVDDFLENLQKHGFTISKQTNDMEKYTDKEIVAELFKRLGVEVPKDGEEWKLEQGDSPKVKGYNYFHTVFNFDGDNLTTMGAYE